MQWECQKGHKWMNSFNNIKRGSWCSTCNQSVSERLTREIFGRKFPNTRPDFIQRLELDGYCEDIGIAFEYNEA